jgi:alpha-tubulin suppressor-like RCC1 family protein
LNDDGQATIPEGIGAVKQLSAGGYHTCAIKTDDTPVCWGGNDTGQTDMPYQRNINRVGGIS